MPIRLRPRALAFVLLSFLLGCSNAPEIPTTGNGELHQGTFVYTCSSPADAHCGASELPSGIAAGADFGLRFDSAPPLTTTLEPNGSFFSVDAAGTLHGLRAGYGVVLVKDASGAVVDFVNLPIRTVALLEVTGVDATTPLAIGQTRTLRASAFDAGAARLAGTLPLEWESADRGVATITVTDDDRSRGQATLRAVGKGTTRIRVIAGSSTGSVSIEVGS